MTQHEIINRNWKKDLWPYLPDGVRALMEHVDAYAPLEEIRIRAGAPVQLRFNGYERLLYGKNGAAPIGEEGCKVLLQRLCEQSVYAWEKELSGGYLTLEGGYRVGLCGRFVQQEGGGPRLTDATGFNIRIARQATGAAKKALPWLVDSAGRLMSTLVVSPPGCGKTTLLRDIGRCCSYGIFGAAPARVGMVDTRYELAGCVRGVPQMDVGPRTDVLCGMGKSEGMRMMVANMAPDILITDEISTIGEAQGVLDAMGCGVTVAASAHAVGAESLTHRRALATLLGQRMFRRIVLLGRSRGVGTVEEILDSGFCRVMEPKQTAKEVSACFVPLLS